MLEFAWFWYLGFLFYPLDEFGNIISSSFPAILLFQNMDVTRGRREEFLHISPCRRLIYIVSVLFPLKFGPSCRSIPYFLTYQGRLFSLDHQTRGYRKLEDSWDIFFAPYKQIAKHIRHVTLLVYTADPWRGNHRIQTTPSPKFGSSRLSEWISHLHQQRSAIAYVRSKVQT